MRQLLAVLLLSLLPVCAQQTDDNATLAKSAVEAERRGDFALAISAFERLIEAGGDSTDVRNNLGIAYFQTGQYQNALEQFRVSLARSPGSLPGNLFSGLSLLKLERPAEAIAPLGKAHAIKPADAQIVLALAQAYLGAKNIAEARDQYRRATELDPNNAEAWYGLGITQRVLAETEAKRAKQAGHAANDLEKTRALLAGSEEAIAKALQADRSSVRSHMIIGEALRIAERYPEAVHEYETAAQQAPNSAAAWAGLAAAYSAAGEDARSVEAGKHALQLDPSDANTVALVAGTYLRQGDSANAETYARHALELQPQITAAHVVLAKVYIARREFQKAVPELQAAAPEDSDGTIHYLLATTLRQLGRTNEATTAMQQYQKLHARALSGAH